MQQQHLLVTAVWVSNKETIDQVHNLRNPVLMGHFLEHTVPHSWTHPKGPSEAINRQDIS